MWFCDAGLNFNYERSDAHRITITTNSCSSVWRSCTWKSARDVHHTNVWYIMYMASVNGLKTILLVFRNTNENLIYIYNTTTSAGSQAIKNGMNNNKKKKPRAVASRITIFKTCFRLSSGGVPSISSDNMTPGQYDGPCAGDGKIRTG